MSVTKQEFSNHVKQFNFREMFNDVGWNNDKTKQFIVVDSLSFSLEAVGEKSGFKILLCHPQSDGLIPDHNTRKKIETKVTKLFQEHLIMKSLISPLTTILNTVWAKNWKMKRNKDKR